MRATVTKIIPTNTTGSGFRVRWDDPATGISHERVMAMDYETNDPYLAAVSEAMRASLGTRFTMTTVAEISRGFVVEVVPAAVEVSTPEAKYPRMTEVQADRQARVLYGRWRASVEAYTLSGSGSAAERVRTTQTDLTEFVQGFDLAGSRYDPRAQPAAKDALRRPPPSDGLYEYAHKVDVEIDTGKASIEFERDGEGRYIATGVCLTCGWRGDPHQAGDWGSFGDCEDAFNEASDESVEHADGEARKARLAAEPSCVIPPMTVPNIDVTGATVEPGDRLVAYELVYVIGLVERDDRPTVDRVGEYGQHHVNLYLASGEVVSLDKVALVQVERAGAVQD